MTWWTELVEHFHQLSFAAGWAAGAAVQFVWMEIVYDREKRR